MILALFLAAVTAGAGPGLENPATPAVPTQASARVKTGLEVLAASDFAPLKGKRIGLITNHTGITSDYRRNIDLLAKAPGVRLTAIFTPEHGLTGARSDPNIESGVDDATGVPVHSLYNRRQFRPTPEMMREVDALVYDIQDIGARFYTYITTLGYMLEAASAAKVPIYVLDRPNPINGVAVEGPMLDEQLVSFVGYMPMPIRHGMTVGELARMYNGEKRLGADLRVVQVEGWRRDAWFDQTGLPWIDPSPNIRNLVQAILYPGVCLLESKVVWVKGGVDTPFQMIGAPWLDARSLAGYLNSRAVPGVSFIARRFRPTAGAYKDQDCQGLEILLWNRDALNAVTLGIELVCAVRKFHADRFSVDVVMRLLGNEAAASRIKAGDDPRSIAAGWAAGLEAFKKVRAKYLLYR